jgi:hypothetical protein
LVKGIVQRVFQEHYPAYRRTHALERRERWAARQIATCRTPAQGFHVWACPHDDYRLLQHNSCKHRSCPLCGAAETERWVQGQQAHLLPCRYHQLVFTIPHDLHPLWHYNRAAFTNLLFRTAWDCVRAFARNPRWLGAEPGALVVFQSWGETLNTHVHLHMVLTAGGLTPAGRWQAPPRDFLFPARALSVKFRGRLRARLLAALAADAWTLPPDSTPARWRHTLNRLGRQRWNVFIAPAYAHARGLIIYLARYLRRGPIAEQRIRAYNGQHLAIAYKRCAEHTHATFQLGAQEFVGRVLTHAPVKGLRIVRAYGLFHHRRRAQLEAARHHCPATPASAEVHAVEGHGSEATTFHRDGPHCPRCHTRLIITLRYYPAANAPTRIAA